MQVRTRIAPSPTGRMHVGTVRTALFNYLFARHHHGAFVARIEDTDRERSRPEYETAIWDDFAWLGIDIDERYKQSEHLASHTAALERMIESNAAYVSAEPSKNDPAKMVEVVRLRNPNKDITFADEIRGSVSFNTTELGDFVVARAIDDPLYHLAVVVDDHEMNITHVIRAEEHLSNTPRQILIQEALGYERPVYAHIPLILAPDRSKLSKRKHAVAISDFRDRGFLPDALLNFLALLGWNPGTEQEIFSRDELIAAFDLAQVQKSGAIFNEEKLRWFNKMYMHQQGNDEWLEKLATAFKAGQSAATDPAVLLRALPALQERVEVWEDLAKSIEKGEWAFLGTQPRVDPAALVWKKSNHTDTKKHLENVLQILSSSPESAFQDAEALKGLVFPYAEENDRGSVLWPLRYALTGLERSPDPFTVLYILGKSESCARLKAAIAAL